MSAWLGWRLVKWLGLFAFSAGLFGSVAAADEEDRRRAAHWVATPGFLVAWLGGYALVRLSGASVGQPWILLGMALSALALQAVVWGVERPDRPRAAVGLVAGASLVACAAVMVFRW